MNQSLGSEIYSGTAAYGKIRTIIGTVMGTIIGLGLTIAGGVLLRRKAKLTETIRAIVVNDPICHSYMNGNIMMWKCDVQLAYKVGDKEYNIHRVTDQSTKYVKGQGVNVFYDPADPSNASLFSDNTKILGWVLLVIGLFLLIGSWVSLFLVLKFKIAAAAAGAAGVISDIRGAFKN